MTTFLTFLNPFSEEDENDSPIFSSSATSPSASSSLTIAISGTSEQEHLSHVPQILSSSISTSSSTASRPSLLNTGVAQAAPPFQSSTPALSEIPSYTKGLNRTSDRTSSYSSQIWDGFFGSSIPGFPIVDDAQDTKTSESLHQSGLVSKVISEGLSRDYWMDDEKCKECHDCKSVFTAWRRKHHCRVCGQIFCSRCASNLIDGSRFEHDSLFRVCNRCLEKLATDVTSHFTPHQLDQSHTISDESRQSPPHGDEIWKPTPENPVPFRRIVAEEEIECGPLATEFHQPQSPRAPFRLESTLTKSLLSSRLTNTSIDATVYSATSYFSGKVLPENLQGIVSKLEATFGDIRQYRKLLSHRDSEAQHLLDTFQMLLDSPGLSAKFRSNLLVATQRLSKSAGLYPACYNLEGVELASKHPVAAGTFADIYKGRLLGQTVCLKVIRLYRASHVASFLRQFSAEAILWGQLSHLNLLPIYGLYQVNARLCLVSPWMKYGDIVVFLKRHPDVDRSLLVSDVASGTAYLHTHDIVHGDLKGANILVNEFGRACLADFGLSAVSDANILHWTSHSFAASKGGSVRWQAPELFDISNEETVYNSKPSDVYAFSCVAYEIFTGDVPFFEIARDTAVMRKVQKGARPSRPPPSSISWEAWGLTEPHWSLMKACWNARPADRPTMRDVVAELASRLPFDDRPVGNLNSVSRTHFRDSVSAQSELPSVEHIEAILDGIPDHAASETGDGFSRVSSLIRRSPSEQRSRSPAQPRTYSTAAHNLSTASPTIPIVILHPYEDGTAARYEEDGHWLNEHSSTALVLSNSLGGDYSAGGDPTDHRTANGTAAETPGADELPLILCDFCGQPLPSTPSATLLSMRDDLEDCTWPEPSVSDNPCHREALTPGVYAAYCERHEFERKHLPKAVTHGWPMDIDFGELYDRVSGLREEVERVMTESGKSEFFLRAKEPHMGGYVNGRWDLLAVPSAGYYGEEGYHIIVLTLQVMFPERDIDLEYFTPLTWNSLLHEFLLPEVAVLLIQEDLGLTREVAINTLLESRRFGNAMHSMEESFVLQSLAQRHCSV